MHPAKNVLNYFHYVTKFFFYNTLINLNRFDKERWEIAKNRELQPFVGNLCPAD